jgi:hypothetical protein
MATATNIIQSITYHDDTAHWLGYTFIVGTNRIVLKIDNVSQCDESFGVYTNVDIEKFIGAEYKSIKVGNVTQMPNCEKGSNEIEIVIYTSKGPIPIRFYNEHNGYYNHDLSIEYDGNTEYVSL